ncbi:hypothetical protein TWF191_000245 [Orbilia oligospora]|uniref:Uncharacterized protein n=1 Tax=Orbilia oligospora TaxID=2813651 RepID=A0A7C8VCP6_ORBOL|nr:hypothetical protein TWF679_007068 [Orbilia oligospora]KAF3230006.1 hypothetical protein TWF191_000245 [Orbilia oligospora]
MSASKATFTALPAEIHSMVFSFIEAHYHKARKIKAWKSDPLPPEIKQLAFINQQWRRLVIGRKFKSQHLPRIEDVRELGKLSSNHPVVATSLRDLTIFVAHTDLPELWLQIEKWAKEGSNLQSLVIKMSYGQTSQQATGGGGKYTLYEFVDSANAEAASSVHVPIPIERLELNTSITDPDEGSDLVLQFGDRSVRILLGRLKTTTYLKLNVFGNCRSRKFLRTTYEATCGYMESIIQFQNEGMKNLTTLELRYNIFMSRQPYNTSTRSFYLDEHVDERGDNLSNLLRQLSKRLKSVLLRYDRATSEIFEPKNGTLSEGETEDWPHLHTFHLIFSDVDAYGYRRSELQAKGNGEAQGEEEEDEEDEEELEPMDGDQEHQHIPKNDNDGFDWLSPDIVDDKIDYQDDRAKRTATSGVRSFYLIAAKAVANKMRAIQSFEMSMSKSFSVLPTSPSIGPKLTRERRLQDLSVDSQVYMEYVNRPPNPKLVVIGHQILEPSDLPDSEDEEGDNQLARIFKEGVGEDVKIKYNLPKSLHSLV